MSTATPLRIGAASAIVGGALFLAAYVLHPDSPTILDVAHSGTWVGVHLGSLFGSLLVFGGLVVLYGSIRGQPGATIAPLALSAAVVGAAVTAVYLAVDGVALKGAADDWSSGLKPTAVLQAHGEASLTVALAVNQTAVGLLSLLVAVRGISFVLFGLAVALSDDFPRWLGWIGFAAGLGETAAGLVLAYERVSVLTDTMEALFTPLVIIWALVMGVFMWRKASTPT